MHPGGGEKKKIFNSTSLDASLIVICRAQRDVPPGLSASAGRGHTLMRSPNFHFSRRAGAVLTPRIVLGVIS